jgi:cadmium resistance protein CadD (predicted permease)
VKLAQALPPGKKIRCNVCQAAFAPRAETIALKDEPPARPAKAAAKPAAPVAAQPARPSVVEDDDDDYNVTPYGVVEESEEEKQLTEKNKPKFTDVRDKYKKSARGPAQGLLVMPVNLLIAEGAITGIVGVLTVIVGLWPLVFTDAPPSDEEIAEQVVIIFGGLVLLGWGSLICVGASKMQSLESYAWALVGAVLGIFPLLAGIFALITLRDPRVIAGFEEVEGAVDDEDEDEEKDDDEDEDDED